MTGVQTCALPICTAGTATHLVFSQQPSNAVSGASIAPAITVTALDASNNVATGFANQISLAIATNAGGGTLTGGGAVSPVSGVATFSGVSIDKSGTGYTLSASATSVSGATSSAFNITAGTATHLTFSQQPTSAVSGASIAPAITVTALDASNNVATGFANQVSLAIANNAGSGTLTGGGAVSPVSGVATFSGVSIDKAGTGYTLSTSAASVTGATSSAFNITAGAAAKISISVGDGQSATVNTAVATAPAVLVTDANGNPVAGVSVNFVVGLGGGSLNGTNPATTNASGIATTGTWTLGTTAGANTLTATASGFSGGGNPVTFNATGTAGAATQLVFTTQPTNAVSGQSIGTVVVTAEDAFGNTDLTFTGTVNMAIANDPSLLHDSQLHGTAGVAAVAGVATFGDLNITSASGGSGYLLGASSGALTGTSTSFNITL